MLAPPRGRNRRWQEQPPVPSRPALASSAADLQPGPRGRRSARACDSRRGPPERRVYAGVGSRSGRAARRGPATARATSRCRPARDAYIATSPHSIQRDGTPTASSSSAPRSATPTAARLAMGPTIFLRRPPSAPGCRGFAPPRSASAAGSHPPAASVAASRSAPSRRIWFPAVIGLLGDAVGAHQVGDLPPSLALAHDRQDLLVGELAPFASVLLLNGGLSF